MNIIRTTIVNPVADDFWKDISQLVAGANPRPLLVLTTTYQAGSKEESQLHKMLGACGLLPEQYNIIQIDTLQKAAWHMLREKLDPKAIFLIGVSPAQLGISALFQLNISNSFDDRYWLPTLSLEQLEQNADIKKQLWTGGMKPLFVDKIYGEILAR